MSISNLILYFYKKQKTEKEKSINKMIYKWKTFPEYLKIKHLFEPSQKLIEINKRNKYNKIIYDSLYSKKIINSSLF